MKEAIRLATENVRAGRGGPFAAVVVKDGQIIASGTNSVTSTNDPTGHAEVNAIREACRVLGAFPTVRVRNLHELRTMPDVPGSDLLGASRPGFLCRDGRRRGRGRL